jgi:hypothetical protein
LEAFTKDEATKSRQSSGRLPETGESRLGGALVITPPYPQALFCCVVFRAGVYRLCVRKIIAACCKRTALPSSNSVGWRGKTV